MKCKGLFCLHILNPVNEQNGGSEYCNEWICQSLEVLNEYLQQNGKSNTKDDDEYIIPKKKKKSQEKGEVRGEKLKEKERRRRQSSKKQKNRRRSIEEEGEEEEEEWRAIGKGKEEESRNQNKNWRGITDRGVKKERVEWTRERERERKQKTRAIDRKEYNPIKSEHEEEEEWITAVEQYEMKKKKKKMMIKEKYSNGTIIQRQEKIKYILRQDDEEEEEEWISEKEIKQKMKKLTKSNDNRNERENEKRRIGKINKEEESKKKRKDDHLKKLRNEKEKSEIDELYTTRLLKIKEQITDNDKNRHQTKRHQIKILPFEEQTITATPSSLRRSRLQLQLQIQPLSQSKIKLPYDKILHEGNQKKTQKERKRDRKSNNTKKKANHQLTSTNYKDVQSNASTMTRMEEITKQKNENERLLQNKNYKYREYEVPTQQLREQRQREKEEYERKKQSIINTIKNQGNRPLLPTPYVHEAAYLDEDEDLWEVEASLQNNEISHDSSLIHQRNPSIHLANDNMRTSTNRYLPRNDTYEIDRCDNNNYLYISNDHNPSYAVENDMVYNKQQDDESYYSNSAYEENSRRRVNQNETYSSLKANDAGQFLNHNGIYDKSRTYHRSNRKGIIYEQVDTEDYPVERYYHNNISNADPIDPWRVIPSRKEQEQTSHHKNYYFERTHEDGSPKILDEAFSVPSNSYRASSVAQQITSRNMNEYFIDVHRSSTSFKELELNIINIRQLGPLTLPLTSWDGEISAKILSLPPLDSTGNNDVANALMVLIKKLSDIENLPLKSFNLQDILALIKARFDQVIVYRDTSTLTIAIIYGLQWHALTESSDSTYRQRQIIIDLFYQIEAWKYIVLYFDSDPRIGDFERFWQTDLHPSVNKKIIVENVNDEHICQLIIGNIIIAKASNKSYSDCLIRAQNQASDFLRALAKSLRISNVS